MTWPPGTALNLLYQLFFLNAPLQNPAQNPGAGEIVGSEITPAYYAGDGTSFVLPFSRPIDPELSVLCLWATNNTPNPLNAEIIANLEIQP